MEHQPYVTEYDISKCDKALVLKALYDNAIIYQPQGLGFLLYKEAPMTVEEANELLSKTTYFDYVKGRVLKVSLKNNELYIGLYDRDNGFGAAKNALLTAGLNIEEITNV